MAEKTTLFAAFMMVLGGTVASSYVSPLASHFFEGYAVRGIAAITAFILVHYKDLLLAGIKKFIGVKSGGQGD